MLERQQVAPKESHPRWKADVGKAAAVAAVIAVAGSAQAAPPSEDLRPIPAGDVAIAPLPDAPDPVSPRMPDEPDQPKATVIQAYAVRVDDLKPNPYVQTREPKHRLTKKQRATETVVRVSDLKANPYE